MTKQSHNKNKSIGQKIKERRERLGLNPSDLAKIVNVQRSRITELEESSKRPSAEKLLQIADALSVPILYFLTDCKLNDVDEDVLLVKYRKLNAKNRKLAIEIIKLMDITKSKLD